MPKLTVAEMSKGMEISNMIVGEGTGRSELTTENGAVLADCELGVKNIRTSSVIMLILVSTYDTWVGATSYSVDAGNDNRTNYPYLFLLLVKSAVCIYIYTVAIKTPDNNYSYD